jgi:hypothetical protein|tara:strand:- start:40 stop:1239 length:1200 start_codon:yes stop_codon:yes gene_type:complete
MALKNNTWKINQWYDQSVAGNVTYTGAGALFAWGDNSGDRAGSLGQNNTTEYSSPTQIPGTTWAQLCGRGDPTSVTATKTDGTLWSWGNNTNGTLGLNDVVFRSSPTQIPGTTWKYDSRFALGGLKFSKFAIKTDGTLWAWGSNSANGVLGLNQYDVKISSPTQIPGSTWSTVEGGNSTYMAAATKTDGTAWVWGYNGYGAMGVNQPTNYRRSSPVQIPGTTWSRIAPSDQFYTTMGVKSDGTLWAMGAGTDGSLGLNQPSGTYVSSPTQIPGTTWTTEITGGNKTWLAVKSDGTLWTWGENSSGTLGQNQAYAQLSAASSPIQIPGTWKHAARLGHGSVMAAKTDGTLWAWGYNADGNRAGLLGLNDKINRSSPTQIPGTSWDKAFSSINQGYAIKQL